MPVDVPTPFLFDVQGAHGRLPVSGVVTDVLPETADIRRDACTTTLSVTDVARRMGEPSETVNMLLAAIGLQTCCLTAHGGIYYELTPEGVTAGGVAQDGDDLMQQLRWPPSVITILEGDDLCPLAA